MVILGGQLLGDNPGALASSLQNKVVRHRTVEEGIAFVIESERITVLQRQEQTVIMREFPSNDDDLDGLAGVASQVISRSGIGSNDQTFGFNIVAICSLSSEEEETESFIANKYFQTDRLRQMGYDSFEGTWQVVFVDGDTRWQMKLEPMTTTDSRAIPLAVISLNSHFENKPIPKDDEAIKQRLREAWHNVTVFANNLERTGC